MLDAFKKGPSKQQASELQSLIAASKEERAALSTMLTQIQLHGAKLSNAGKALQDVEEKAAKATSRLNEVTDRLAKADARAEELGALDARIKALTEAVAAAEQQNNRLTAPDGELEQQRQALQTVTDQAVQVRASFEALQQDQAALAEVREQLRETQRELRESVAGTEGLKGEFDGLRSASVDLAQEVARVKELTRDSREDANHAVEIVKEVGKRLGPLTELQSLVNTTDERMTSLNALAEHVSQKVKSLENQKHTVERAVLESTRLNEMIWNMEIQINKLNEAGQQATRTEELVDRAEKIFGDVSAQLEAATKVRDSLAGELSRLEHDRGALTEFVRTASDRLSVERREFDAFDLRVKALQTTIGEAEKSMEGLAARDRTAAYLAQRVDQLARQMQTLNTHADEIQGKHASLESVHESLAEVDALGKRTAAQFESLKQSRVDLEALRKEIQDFYTAHAEVMRLRDRLADDRGALESFLESDVHVQGRDPGARGEAPGNQRQAVGGRRPESEGRPPRSSCRGSRAADDASGHAAAARRTCRGPTELARYAGHRRGWQARVADRARLPN